MTPPDRSKPLPRGSFEGAWRGLRLMALPPGRSVFELTPERHVIAIQLEEAEHHIAIGRDRMARRAIEPGSVCWLPPGVDFKLDGTCRSFNLLMELDASATRPFADDELADPLDLAVDGAIARTARAALDLLFTPLPDPLKVEELGLAMLDRSLALRGHSAPTLRPHGEDRRIRNALEYIDANLCAQMSVCAIADAAQMSAPHFSRLFRQAAGRPVWAYLMERRCDRAKDMLTNTKESIAEIAIGAGFHDQPHMTKAFRTLLGITPAALRASVTG